MNKSVVFWQHSPCFSNYQLNISDGAADDESFAILSDLNKCYETRYEDFADWPDWAINCGYTQSPVKKTDMFQEPVIGTMKNMDLQPEDRYHLDFASNEATGFQTKNDENQSLLTAFTSLEQIEMPVSRLSAIRLSHNQKSAVKIITQIYNGKSMVKNENKSFQEACEAAKIEFNRRMEAYCSTLSKSTQKDPQKLINLKRCNQTKYVRTLLRSFVLAADKIKDTHSEETFLLFEELDSCSRVQQIHEALSKPSRSDIVSFIKQFAIPGHLMVAVLERLHYKPQILILLLECLLVLQKMLLEPTHRFNTWKLERIETKGNYSQALEKLEDGTATVAWVKDYVNKEYLKCKEKFKRKKCSDKNNIMHFIVNLTVQMLNTIKQEVDSFPFAFSIQTTILKEEIQKSLYILLQGKGSEQTMMLALQHPIVKSILRTKYIDNYEFLKMILKTYTTSALMISNLVNKYDWFVGLLY